AEDGIRDRNVTGVQTCALPILEAPNPLLEDMNIIVRGTVRRNAEGDIDLQHFIVPLYTEGKVTAYCLAVPYLRQGDYPSAENYRSEERRVGKECRSARWS